MSTVRTTELAAKLTGDAKGLIAELDKTKVSMRDLGAAATQATDASDRGLGKVATSSKKAAMAVGSTVDALADMERRGAAAFNDLARQGSEFAALLGPGGAIVGAVGIATVAIVNIFIRSKRELKELRQSFQEELRAMQRAGDGTGLAKRAQQLYSGDPYLGTEGSAEEQGNAQLARQNRQIRAGGILGTEAEIARRQSELDRLLAGDTDPALGSRGVVEITNRKRALEDLRTTLGELRAQYDQVAPAAERAIGATVEQSDAVVRLEDAEQRRAKSTERATRDAAKAADAQRRAVAAFAAATTETEKYTATVDAAGDPLAIFANRFAEIEREIAAATAALPAAQRAAAEITGRTLLDQLADAGDRLRESRGVELAQKLTALLANGSSDAVAKLSQEYSALALQYEDIAAAAEKLGTVEGKATAQRAREQLPALEKEREQLAKVITITREFAEALKVTTAYQDIANASVADNTVTLSDRNRALQQLAEKERELQGIIAASPEGSKPRLEAEQALAALRARAPQQAADVADETVRAVDAAAALGDGLRDVAQGGLTLLQILGQNNTALGGMLTSVLSIGAGLDDLASAAKQAGGFGKLFSSGGTAMSALGPLATIAGGLLSFADGADLFGNKQRAEMRRRAEEFNDTLALFGRDVVDRTAGEFRRAKTELEREIGDLASQAADNAGFTSRPGAQFSGAQLRTFIDDRKQEAAGLVTSTDPGELARLAKLNRFIAALEQVAVTAGEAEAALRAEQAVQLRTLSEDLEARRLTVAGRTEDAARRRDELAAQRSINQAIEDYIGAEGAEAYVAALQAITAAELAAAEATRKRATALRTLDETIAVLGLGTQEALQHTIGTLSNLSPEIAAIFDGIDLTTRDGLTEAQTRLRDLFRTLLSDGVISEAEQPLVDLIKQLLGSIGAAVNDLGTGLASSLDAFAIRAEVFGLSAAEQLAGLVEIFAGQFDALDAVLQDPTLTGSANAGALRDRLQNEIATILQGGITDDEQPLLAALRQLLGVVVQQIDDAAADAEAEAARIAQAQADARGTRRARAALRIDLFDLEGADAFRETLNGYGASFANLFAQFDPSTQEGIDGAAGTLASIFDELDTLTDDQLLQRFGMTRDELTAALAQLDGGLDSLGASLESVAADAQAAADAAQDFADSIAVDFIRATQGDQAADLAAAAERRDQQLAEATEKGLGQSVFDQIDAIYQDAVRRINARYAPDAAAAPGAGVDPRAAGARDTRRGQGTARVSGDLGGLSEVTGQSLAGVLVEISKYTSRTAVAAESLAVGLARALQPLGTMPAPQLAIGNSTAAIGAGSTSTSGGGPLIGSITVNVAALNPLGATPEVAARETVDAIAKHVMAEIGREARAEVRFLGSNQRIRGR